MRPRRTFAILTVATLFLGFIFLSPPLQADNAPVTFASNIINAVPGTPSVPVSVKVTGFTDIGKFTLTMKFDTTRVRFVSATPNPSLPGMTVTYTSPPSGKLGKLVFSWSSASNSSLADSSALASLVFSYVTGTGLLEWYFYGSICEYRRWVGGTLTRLNDSPTCQYYKNGGISNRGAPVATLATVTNAAPGYVYVPVTADNFTNIGSCTLNFDYANAGLTFVSGTANASLSTAIISDADIGSGKHRVSFGWYNGSGVTLSNGSTIMTIKFAYSTGNTALEFFDDVGSCEYADGSADVLIDLPYAMYYHNGGVTPPLVAGFSANKLTPQKNETVTFTDFTTGYPSAWNWSFDRPGAWFVGGTSATSQNPQVQFSSGGLYTVTLIASNAFLSDPETKTGYIRVGLAGIWTGETSSDWSVTTNWENWLVPDGSTKVTIPAAAAHWPVFSGDMVLGTHCSNLTLSGTTSRLTVTGNIVIQ